MRAPSDPGKSLRGARNRLCQVLALYAPGATTTRVRLHRWRGVDIGENVFIGTGALLETAMPERVSIGSGVTLSIRTIIVAHFRWSTAVDDDSGGERFSVRIKDEAFIGPGAIILPNVTVGEGAVVTAGSVVTRAVAPMTMVQGNPAKPVARCGVPLGRTAQVSLKDFYRQLTPIRPVGGKVSRSDR